MGDIFLQPVLLFVAALIFYARSGAAPFGGGFAVAEDRRPSCLRCRSASSGARLPGRRARRPSLSSRRGGCFSDEPMTSWGRSRHFSKSGDPPTLFRAILFIRLVVTGQCRKFFGTGFVSRFEDAVVSILTRGELFIIFPRSSLTKISTIHCIFFDCTGSSSSFCRIFLFLVVITDEIRNLTSPLF
ncbi:hypothetical protein KSP40_PGU019083 [Platanthera guangdongensis]|uniref:Secreted protein n=1 Tax=Platanthera guangdongensis TaxID=2320717 RepID=A0ABR2MPJ5_9ASPA